MTYFVETYGGDGTYTEPQLTEHETIEDALADASDRLGRAVKLPPDWIPGHDMSPTVPQGSRPVGAWHESDLELCGGVAL